MTYPQQPGNWSDPNWPSQPAGYDPKSPYADPSATPTSGPEQAAPPGYPAAGYGGYPAAGYGGYPAPGYPGYPGYPVVAAPETNGMAIAAMVVSIVGILGLCGYGLGGYIGAVGAILGHVSRRQIRERGQNGDGMAVAGIIVGWIATAIALIATALIVVFIVLAANSEPSTFDSGY